MSDIIRDLREKITRAREHEEWESVRALADDMIKRTTGNGFALRAMVQACERLGDRQSLPDVWTALVDEAREILPFSLHLAAHHRAEGFRSRALHYYDLALEQALEDRDESSIEACWMDLVECAPERLPVFLRCAQQLRAKKMESVAAVLLGMLTDHYETAGTPEQRLALARELAICAPDDPKARKALVAQYRAAYKDHEQLDALIDKADLAGKRPIHEAVAQLDRELTFDQNECVMHKGWGVGVIRKHDVEKGRIVIDFPGKSEHVMSLEMAERTLIHLDHDDLRAMSATRKDDLPRMAEEERLALMHATIKACGGTGTARDIKGLLVDLAVPMRSWTSWWTETNKVLKTDPMVDVSGMGANRKYTLRERPLDLGEEVLGRYQAARDPLDKLRVLSAHVQDVPQEQRDAGLLRELLEDLRDAIPGAKPAAAQVQLVLGLPAVAQAAGLDELEGLPALADQVPNDPKSAIDILTTIGSSSHQDTYAEAMVVHFGERWGAVLKKYIPTVSDDVRDAMARHSPRETLHPLLSEWFMQTQRAPQSNPAFYLWLAREILCSQQKVEWAQASPGPVFDQVLRLLDFASYRARTSAKQAEKVKMRAYVGAARRIIKTGSFLAVRRVLDDASPIQATRFLNIFKETPGLDEPTRKDLVRLVYELHPDLTTQSTSENATTVPDDTVYCLVSSLLESRKKLRRLREDEVPRNAREVERARQLGDLRENAEYKAALEQRDFLQAQIKDLQLLLDKAKPVTPEEVSVNRIGFGTRVTMRDTTTDAVETVTFLGPWESAPEQGILSYLSPRGLALYGRQLGDLVAIPGSSAREVLVETIENAITEVPAKVPTEVPAEGPTEPVAEEL